MGERKRGLVAGLGKLVLHLLAIVPLSWALWTQMFEWVYHPGFAGVDTPQFIYYVHYFRRHLRLPPVSWHHQWFMGAPRVLDQTFLHFYLIQPLVGWLGSWLAIKVYPMIFFWIFIVASYLIFWRLSKSWLVALGLGLGVALSTSV
ncbi:hypothetical protein MUP65_01420 [Patescibacteria group bacterium]|nr:hypothetical protein [Patescibacteria group bacterium]